LRTASAAFAAQLDRSEVIVAYTDEHRDEFGVGPSAVRCKWLATTYAAKTRELAP